MSNFIGYIDVRDGQFYDSPADSHNSIVPFYYIPVTADGNLFGFDYLRVIKTNYVSLKNMQIAGCNLHTLLCGKFLVERPDSSYYITDSLDIALTEIVSVNKAVNFFYYNGSRKEIYIEIVPAMGGYYLNKFEPSLGWDLMVKRSSRSLTFEELKALYIFDDISFIDNMF